MSKELNLKEEYEVTILKQDHFGQGITKINDVFVFVKEGLPEEQCKIKITNIKKKFGNAELTEIIVPSKVRVKPKCPYYHTCGGCHIMHEEYQEQLHFKENKVKEVLERFTDMKEVNIFPIQFGKPFFYRNKVTFHGNKNKLGYYQEKTNKIIEIDTCVIADSKINEIFKNIQIFLKKHPETSIKKLMIRITFLEETMVVLEGKVNKELLLSTLTDVHTIYLNNQLVKGNSSITEEIFGKYFQIYPTSFFQVNYHVMLELYQLVIDFYKKRKYQTVLDLYCGTGTIGMLISPYVERVIGVEKEESSILSANECKTRNNVENIEFIQGKVEDFIDSFSNIDSIIIDPPRSGLDSYTIDIILKLSPKTITYISCDPVTLARDLKSLKEEYEILEIHPFDMFPNTYHVECICYISKK